VDANIDLNKTQVNGRSGAPLGGGGPTGLWWYDPYCSPVSPTCRSNPSVTYKEELFLQVQGHGAECGTVSRVRAVKGLHHVSRRVAAEQDFGRRLGPSLPAKRQATRNGAEGPSDCLLHGRGRRAGPRWAHVSRRWKITGSALPPCSSLRRAGQCQCCSPDLHAHPRLQLLPLPLWHQPPYLAQSHWDPCAWTAGRYLRTIGSQVVRASSLRLARPSLTPVSTVNISPRRH
jgi:hypothetical protein